MLHTFSTRILLAGSLPVNSCSLPLSSFPFPSLISKYVEFYPLLFVAIFFFFRNWALRSQNPYTWKKGPKVNKFKNSTTMATPFPAEKHAGWKNASHDFRQRKYNIHLPPDRLTPDSLPSPPPNSVRAGVRWCHKQNLSDRWFTKFS